MSSGRTSGVRSKSGKTECLSSRAHQAGFISGIRRRQRDARMHHARSPDTRLTMERILEVTADLTASGDRVAAGRRFFDLRSRETAVGFVGLAGDFNPPHVTPSRFRLALSAARATSGHCSGRRSARRRDIMLCPGRLALGLLTLLFTAIGRDRSSMTTRSPTISSWQRVMCHRTCPGPPAI
jgi:hypothetical protein